MVSPTSASVELVDVGLRDHAAVGQVGEVGAAAGTGADGLDELLGMACPRSRGCMTGRTTRRP
jgi:hypothetical protein